MELQSWLAAIVHVSANEPTASVIEPIYEITHDLIAANHPAAMTPASQPQNDD